MIYPNKKKFHYRLLMWYVNRILKSDFEDINLDGKVSKNNQSILLLANHSTWWDGFWIMHINQKLLKKNFYVLMLEEELKKRKFFTKIGAYSIDPLKGKIKDSLVFTQKLLSEKNNLVLFFPEGKFSPTSQSEKKFNKGVSFLYKYGVPFKTVFVTFLTDYFQNRKPTLNLYYEEKEFAPEVTHIEIEQAYNDFYNSSIEKQKLLAQ